MLGRKFRFTTKNCLFGATNIVKTIDKERYVYSGYGIAFGRKGEWSFGNDYHFGNVISSYTDNLKNNFLVLGEGDTFGINGSHPAGTRHLRNVS